MSGIAVGPHEVRLRRATGRLLHIDDQERIGAYQRILSSPPPRIDTLSERDRRLIHMLVAAVGDRVISRDMTIQGAADILWAHPTVRAELRELLGVLADRVDHMHVPLARTSGRPASDPRSLQPHRDPRRRRGEPRSEGRRLAEWSLRSQRCQRRTARIHSGQEQRRLFPKTRYRDYAISRTLIHWESQSNTRADSDTGLRYRNHERKGRSILLFTRLRADERAFWFLGPATYRSHVGEKPMAITWELTHALPGDLYAAFAAAVA